MLSRTLEHTLRAALALAQERRHEYATLEHLLLALLDDGDASAVLRACGVDVGRLRSGLVEFVDKDLAGLVAERAGDPKPNAGFQRVVQRAAMDVQSSGRDEVTGANVLLTLFSERESHAVYFLQLQDMTRLDAVNFISHGIAKAAVAPGSTAAGVFVVLSPGPGMAEAWAQGFAPAIRAAGYRADPAGPAGLSSGIARATLDRIRRSRLVVADLTREDGAPHYAAGFAAGFGLPVVPTCRAEGAPSLREGDARYGGVLLWRTPGGLAAELEARIVGALGRGPGAAEEARDEAVEGVLLDTMTAAVKTLIARGRERGWVTYDEINAALPGDQVSSELIEDTLTMLSDMGITPVEEEEGEDPPRAP